MIWMQIIPKYEVDAPWIYWDPSYVTDDFGNEIYLSDELFEQAEAHLDNNGNGGFYDDQWEIEWR